MLLEFDKKEVFDLFTLHNDKIENLPEVSDLSIKVSSTTTFTSKGLYSVDIFGDIGSENRTKQFAQIDLHLPILNPHIFKVIVSINKNYEFILNGSKTVKFNEKLGNFVDDPKGETGYDYFLKYLDKIKYNKDDISRLKTSHIELMEVMEKDIILLKHCIVIPPAYREYTVKNDVPSEDEINPMYRTIMRLANTLVTVKQDSANLRVNEIRYRIQLGINIIYQHIFDLLKGKTGFIESKFLKRSVYNGSFNVLTPVNNQILDLDDNSKILPDVNHVYMGILQFFKTFKDKALYHLNDIFINRIFDVTTDQARLVTEANRKYSIGVDTLDPELMEKWTTSKGLEKLMNELYKKDNINKHIMIEDKYLCLLGKDKNGVHILTRDSDISLYNNVSPITYGEFIYIAYSTMEDEVYGTFTRYPVLGKGSIFPAKFPVLTTLNSYPTQIHIDDNTVIMVKNYPMVGENYFNSLSPHDAKRPKLGMDYDGDKGKVQPVQTEEALNEMKDLFEDPEYYVVDGKLEDIIDDDLPFNQVIKLLSYMD